MTVPGTAPEVAGLAPELAGAKEGQGSKPLASASERFTSYDVEAFEVPGGREENWRFTPMRRLHGLHDGTAAFDGTAAYEVAAVDGVTVETVGRDDSRIGEGGVPADRVAAAAWSAFAEATVSKVSDDQLFYLMSRGLTEDEAMAMVVRGFVEPIARELPMEYALELNRLIELQMEGSVG